MSNIETLGTIKPKRLILGIDPGPVLSAYVLWDPDNKEVISHRKDENHILDDWFYTTCTYYNQHGVIVDVNIEMLQSFGSAIGSSCLESCVWIGRFMSTIGEELHHERIHRTYRATIKYWHCLKRGANDGQVRRVMIDKVGAYLVRQPKNPPKVPKPISYNSRFILSDDEWQALAAALYYEETDKPGIERKIDQYGVFE